MNKLRCLVASALVFACANVFANSRSYDEAQALARRTLVNSENIVLSDVKTVNGDTVCYTFSGSKGGYAVISADNRVPSVLAYSEKGKVYPKLQSMLDMFVENIGSNQHQNMDLSASAESSELRATRITNTPISPLLNDIKWGQMAPFNLNAPVVNNENAPIGCVATAMSQLMCYYRYPDATKTDIPAYTTKTEGFAMEGIAKGTVIDWDNILRTYNNGYADKNATAVANLMSMAASSVKMDYMEGGSSSDKACVEELVNVFGYDPDIIHLSFRKSYTFAEWSQIIYNELKNKRPVLFAGYTVAGGHRFLCDGIDENGLFHINWGWNGDYDGYYDLALLNPNTTDEAGASSSTDGYSKNNYIVYGIQPDNGIKDEVQDRPDIDAFDVSYQVEGGKIYLFFSYGNLSHETKNLHLASGYKDANGNIVIVSDYGEEEMDPFATYDLLESTSVDFSTFKEGQTYKVGLVESADGVNWRPSTGFDNVNCVFHVEDGILKIGKAILTASLEIKDFSFIGQYAHGTIHLKNSGSKEYYNNIYLMTSRENVNPRSYSYVAYATAEAKDSNDVDFKFIPTADTMYYWVMDAYMSALDSGVVVRNEQEQKISASARIDTTSFGNHICRITLKNEGKTYYDNVIRAILFNNEGESTLEKYIYLEPGDEIEVSFEVNAELNYTQYYIYDYYAEKIASGNFVEEVDSRLLIDFSCKEYNTTDKVVIGDFVVRNGTSEKFTKSYMILLDTTGTHSGGVYLDKVDIEVEPHSMNRYPVTLPVGIDSCTLLLVPTDGTSGPYLELWATDDGNSVDDIVADGEKIRVWVRESTLVVEAIDDAMLQVSSVNGCNIVSRRLRKNEVFMHNLPSGIYVVNGKKILIK